MRSLPSGVGRLFGSVAMRYRHPCAVGVRSGGLHQEKRALYGAFFRKNTHEGGVTTPHDDQLARLEAAFFLSQQPQTSRKLAQLAGLADGTKARTLVRALNRRYDALGSAFRVEEVAGGFQLMTRSKFAPWLRRLHSAPAEVRLSAPAMETLAVVAYRQPVLRTEVEAIRGVQSGEVLRQLIERDLVRIVGRSDELGRPFLYGTTRQFLQAFGLRHLEELPRADVLRNPSHQSPVAEEETNVKTLIITEPRQDTLADEPCATAICPGRDDRAANQGVFDKHDEDEEDDVEDEDDDDLDDEEDFDDDFDDDEEEEEDEDEEEEDDDDDIDDEPWEEVEDEDEDLDEEDEDWDEDEDWEDEDEDWDEDDEDDDEEEGEEEEKE
jgi:segregation and condensation protein B